MAITPDGKTLYPMLEGALITDADQQRLIINEFDIRKRRYTGQQWFYRLESASHAIGDFTAVTENHFLVIERDGGQGAARSSRRSSSSIFEEVGADGFLVKRQVADLLNIADPRRPRRASPSVPLPVHDDRERHPARRCARSACSTTTTTLQHGPHTRPARPERVHHHPPRSATGRFPG